MFINEEMKNKKDFDEIYSVFQWDIPHEYNIASDVCDRHSENENSLAMLFEDEHGNVTEYTFQEFSIWSNRLSNALNRFGIKKGDRVAILLPPGPEAAVSHLSLFKIGAISVPLSQMFGPDAIDHRLKDSAAKAILINDQNKGKLSKIRYRLDCLNNIFVFGECEGEEIDIRSETLNSPHTLNTEPMLASDPAIIVYTSGTTGLPKGALHAHQCIPGRLTGFEMAHNFFPHHGDIYWSPADWAWIGGLLDSLFAPWVYGVPVVVFQRKRFDPEKTFELLKKYAIRNAFLPPTALKIMKQASEPKHKLGLKFRSIHSGGETLPIEILDFGRDVFGSICEMYGMTEMGFVVGNCPEILKMKPGSMGKAYPGHIVEILDEEGRILPPGKTGEIAIHRSDPGMFLGYWGDSEGTLKKYKGEWFLSSDVAFKDEEGYFWYQGRMDDVIISAGYRIGPAEIEKCIFRHSSVEDVAVVGSPDPVRGKIVKAFIQLRKGEEPSELLEEEIKKTVKNRLSAHEYPREIEFLEQMPRTTTGKIRRHVLREMEEKRKPSLS